MIVLVINTGSSTVKFSVIDTSSNEELLRGRVENIGEDAKLILDKSVIDIEAKTHEDALSRVVDVLKEEGLLDRIDVVGHRVVHGGEITQPVILGEEVIKEIEKHNDLAPLHNPFNLLGIRVLMGLIKKKHVAVFDTAFHSSIPIENRIYAIPYSFYEQGIKRYGFHGISHEYIAIKAREILEEMNKPYSRIITCHIGSGVSITAVKNGKSVMTSMGYTPLEGLIMSSRSGSIDPGIVLELVEKHGLDKTKQILLKESGWKGLSGIGMDYRKIKELYGKDERATLTINVIANRLAEFIAAYTTHLDGLDALVFSAGVGENDYLVRSLTCKRLRHLGVILDEEKNKKNEQVISSSDSKVVVLVIPTNEELMIALEAERVVNT